jgi:hypothetical protein
MDDSEKKQVQQFINDVEAMLRDAVKRCAISKVSARFETSTIMEVSASFTEPRKDLRLSDGALLREQMTHPIGSWALWMASGTHSCARLAQRLGARSAPAADT